MAALPAGAGAAAAAAAATSAFAAVHAPIPVDQRTHEGRYVWDQRLNPFAATLASTGSPELVLASQAAAMGALSRSGAAARRSPYLDRISPYLDPVYNPPPPRPAPR